MKDLVLLVLASVMFPSVDGRRRSTRRKRLFVRVNSDVGAVLAASYVSVPCCRGRKGVDKRIYLTRS